MGIDNKVIRFVLQGKIVHLKIAHSFSLKREAGARQCLPIIIVDDHSPSAVVELQIADSLASSVMTKHRWQSSMAKCFSIMG